MFGLTGHAPDFAMLMVGANMGVSGMTKEHLGEKRGDKKEDRRREEGEGKRKGEREERRGRLVRIWVLLARLKSI